jgi:predicted helicase
VQELFPVNGVGITTAHDEFVIGNKDVLVKRFKQFRLSLPIPEELHAKFDVKKKNGWNILDGWQNIQNSADVSQYIKILSYRPFDNRSIFYEDKLVWRRVWKIMQHFLAGENVGLITGRQGQVVGSMPWNLAFVSNNIIDINLYYRGGGTVFPLYLYAEQATLDNAQRTPNLDAKIVAEICQRTGLQFADDTPPSTGGKLRNSPPVEGGHFAQQNDGVVSTKTRNTFAPIDLLDYIYAVLHSPNYREQYKEFLKIDFPRVPYPDDVKKFWKLVKLGERLRRLHLMEGIESQPGLANYDIKGNNVVEELRYNAPPVEGAGGGRVWINDTQYFDHVPPDVWNFYIGGYQPAQKWLKDRKGRTLNFDDIEHYQKIVAILKETMEIMNEVDKAMQG